MDAANIILLGESGVGKTALLNRLETGEFRPSSATTQLTVHFKNIILENKAIAITIEDTAGQERFRSLTKNYYRHAEGALLVYDVTHAESFQKLDSWLKELRNENENAEVLIVGNKNEEPEKKIVDVSLIKKFATKNNLEYMEASAKSGENVEKTFLYLARKILVRKGVLETEYVSSVVLANTQKNASLPQKLRQRRPPIADDDIIRLEASMKLLKIKEKMGCCGLIAV